jgi:small subunit ribosomal protein S1
VREKGGEAFMIVAIDGPAGCGKSSVARMVAEKLGFSYVNSGNVYRAITLKVLDAGIDPENADAASMLAGSAKIAYVSGRLSLDGEIVEDKLHSDRVDRWVAQVSRYPAVREKANSVVVSCARSADAVVEGRDMTTVVFPDAEVRIFLDASVQARAKRRFDQGVSELSLGEIVKNLEMRDEIDRSKGASSLKLAEGVVYIDTSDLTIDEVYERVARKINHQGKHMDQKEVAKGAAQANVSNIQTQLQEQYLKSLEQLEEGDVVDGAVVQVTSDTVFVDVGYKSEGTIPLEEFSTKPNIGDIVPVVLLKKESADGKVVVSKKRADEKIFWRNISNAFKNHEPIEGVIEKVVKGGYEVNLGHGFRAFLPISQSDIQKVEKPEKLLGISSRFFIDRLYSEKKVNIVVTRRNLLEQEVEKHREEFFSTAAIGDEVHGIVKSFTSFGAFIDLGGFDGLLHINDMSWGHVARPKDFVRKGQEITLKVIRLDPEEKRINLSLKHFTPDPWSTFEERYHVNDVVKGHVTKLTDFGAFIEVEEGIEGLAHISEFSWVRKIKNPNEVVKIGDEVQCMILGYDLQAGRVSLGLKQVTQNPWNELSEKYPAGMRLTRKIVKVTSAGAFIELEEGIDGFLHVDDLSWTKKVRNPASELEVGNEIEVMVIENDGEHRSVRLGVKQLNEDPWQSFTTAFRVGSVVEGEVTNVTDFGVFIRVQGGIEGLIPKQNLVDSRDESFEDALKKRSVGEKLKAVITELSPDRQKITFSIKDYHRRQAQEELSQYIQGEEDGSGFTLGDILKNKG